LWFSPMPARIRQWALSLREKKGKQPRSDRWAKAERSVDKYGIFGMAVLGPIIIGTQFAAAVSVAAGVRPLSVSIIIGIAMIIWAVVFALLSIWLIGVGGFDTFLDS